MEKNSQNVRLNICYGCMKSMEDGQFICQSCGYNSSHRNNPEDTLPEGSVLNGKYLVGKVLGRGGFGVTYLGYEMNLQIRVAIKEFFPMGMSSRSSQNYSVISSTTVEDESFSKGCAAFLDEARTLAIINSPYVVHVRDYFREHSTAYLIMDFVEGKTLATEMKENEGRISPDRLFSLINPMILEIEKLHKKNIIHRDIAPDNLVVVRDETTGDEHLVLLDFGAARSFVNSQISQKYTATVKAGFAPLEQYSQKSKQGPYTDVYALCATIYYSLTGIVPPSALERSADGAQIASIDSFGVELPEYVEQAIMHGLVQSSENRTQTMRQLYEELTTPPDENMLKYNAAIALMDKATTEEEFRKAEKEFSELGAYKNAPAQADRCKEKAEECHKRNLYAQAKERMAEDTLSAYKDAARKLEELGTWQYAAQQVDYCRLKIEALNGTNKPKPKLLPIIIAVLVAAGAIAFAMLRKPVTVVDNTRVDELQEQVESLTAERDDAVKKAQEEEEARIAAQEAQRIAEDALKAANDALREAQDEAENAKAEAERLKSAQADAEAAAKAKEEEAARAKADAEEAARSAAEAKAAAEAAEKRAAEAEKSAGASTSENEEALKEARAAAEAAEKKAADAEAEAKARSEEAIKAKAEAEAATKSAEEARAEAEAAEKRASEATEAKEAAEQKAAEATEAKAAAEQRADTAVKEKEDLEAKEEQRRKEEYDDAVSLFSNGEYDAAKIIFLKLGDYSDCRSYIVKCEEAIDEINRIRQEEERKPVILSLQLDENNNPVIIWEALENVDYYTIYRSDDLLSYSNLVTTKSTDYTIKSCKEGREYYFKIKAKFADGTFSEFSEVGSIVIPQGSPVILSLQLDENNYPVITWRALENVDYYTIYRSDDLISYSNLVTTKSTDYTIKSCKEGREYYFKIKATFVDGTYSGFSETKAIVIPQSSLVESSIVNEEALYTEALALLEEGKYSDAEVAFEGLDNYKDSAEKLSEVRYFLGLGYETGSSGVKNKRLALSYFRLAADDGHADAINKLGEYAYYGIGRSQDYQEAFELFEQASDLGSVDAYYNLGLCYETGSNVVKNERLALSYYQMAADDGHADAINKLGEFAYYGIGREQDYREAFERFEEASDLGSVEAYYNLGLCYENGYGTGKNEKTAMAYYNIAADEGHQEALKKINR